MQHARRADVIPNITDHWDDSTLYRVFHKTRLNILTYWPCTPVDTSISVGTCDYLHICVWEKWYCLLYNPFVFLLPLRWTLSLSQSCFCIYASPKATSGDKDLFVKHVSTCDNWRTLRLKQWRTRWMTSTLIFIYDTIDMFEDGIYLRM